MLPKRPTKAQVVRTILRSDKFPIAADRAFTRLRADSSTGRCLKAPTRETQPFGDKVVLAAALCLAGAIPALASDRWEEAGSGAVAILPVPKPATGDHRRVALLRRAALGLPVPHRARGRLAGGQRREGEAQRRQRQSRARRRDFAGRREGRRSRRDPAAAEGGDQARRRDRDGRGCAARRRSTCARRSW